MVQTDLNCKILVYDIIENSNNQSDFGNTRSYCRSSLSRLPNFKISFVKRQPDYVAHILAKVSKLFVRYRIFDLIPSCITSILINEIT